MTISIVRLYNPVLWEYSRAYRWLLVLGRMMELSLTLLRFLVISIPLRLIFGEKAPDLAPASDILLEGTRFQDRSDFGTVGWEREYWEKDRKKGVSGRLGGGHGGWGLVRVLLEELGPTFIKVGQIASMPTFVPPRLRTELQHLQERVPTVEFKTIKRSLEREFRLPLEEVFSYFEERPFASASLAQVHRAKLRREGLEVAVKVQRPYLPAIVAVDLVIIDLLFTVLKIALPELRRKSDVGVFTTSFKGLLRDEIDFVLEAANQDRVRRYYMENEYFRGYVKIAEPYWDYVTGKVLVMELLKGMMRIDTEEVLEAFRKTSSIGIPKWDVNRWPFVNMQAAFLYDGFLQQHLVYVDTHFGNIYFSPTEKHFFLVDFGMCAPMSDKEVGLVTDLILSFYLYTDGNKLAEAALAMHVHQGGKRDKIDKSELEERCRRFVNRRFHGGESPVQAWGGGDMISDLAPTLAGAGLQLPPFLWYFLKGTIGLVRLAVLTDPRFDGRLCLVGYFAEYIKKNILLDLEKKNIGDIHDSLNNIVPNFLNVPDAEMIIWGLAKVNAAQDTESRAAKKIFEGTYQIRGERREVNEQPARV